jgi:hypothetical protein
MKICSVAVGEDPRKDVEWIRDRTYSIAAARALCFAESAESRKENIAALVKWNRIASDVLFAALVWREDPVARAQTNCVGCEGLPWKASKILS